MEKKVLFTASTASHIRNFHLPYLRAFCEHGWTVHVACGGPEAVIPDAHEVKILPFRKKMLAAENLQAARTLRRMMEEEQYDLISTHTSLAAFFTRVAVKGMKKRPPVACMVHGYLFDEETPWLKQAVLLTAEKWMASVTDLLFTMNEWDYALAKKHRLGTRVVSVPGVGVDFSRLDACPELTREVLRNQLNIPEDAVVMLYPAEFSERKSQAVLIRAMACLPGRAVLVLAGDGEQLEDCKALAKGLGVADRVRFPGHVSPIGPWYRMADIAVSASRSEGLPFNIMEAMYSGLPVVASGVKGHTDLLQRSGAGLLYPYGDEELCAEAIQMLMGSEDMREHLGAAGRREVVQYSLDQALPGIMELYEELALEDKAKPVAR